MDRELVLPPAVVGPADVSRLKRELEGLEDYLHQAKLRTAGHSSGKPPRPSRLLGTLTEANHAQLLEAADRRRLLAFLKLAQEHAPVVHISFASDPSAAFTSKIVSWFRTNIHPQLLVQVGLQPGIAAGCVVRTPNQYYDFSLRRQFSGKRALLVDSLKGQPLGNDG